MRAKRARMFARVIVPSLYPFVFATLRIMFGVSWKVTLTAEPGIHRIGQTEPSAYDRAQAREAGIFWLIVSAVLAAMATTAALALSPAWRKRR